MVIRILCEMSCYYFFLQIQFAQRMASLRACGRLNLYQRHGDTVHNIFQAITNKPNIHISQYSELSCCFKHALHKIKVSHVKQPVRHFINDASQKSGLTYKLYRNWSRSGINQQTSCLFHTTPRRHIPPILLALLQPFAKISAALAGRYVIQCNYLLSLL